MHLRRVQRHVIIGMNFSTNISGSYLFSESLLPEKDGLIEFARRSVVWEDL